MHFSSFSNVFSKINKVKKNNDLELQYHSLFLIQAQSFLEIMNEKEYNNSEILINEWKHLILRDISMWSLLSLLKLPFGLL